ncbi:MAG TPA: chloride channel protein [Candidatus Binataceae bacterium]|nr:chloride channel protein [Candidatus Binataceae bacterium]
MDVLDSILDSNLLNRPRLRRYTALVHKDLSETYSRDIQKWLLVAPIIGVATGVVISGITLIILELLWARILPFYLAHHWLIVPGLLAGFVITGLIMQFLTPDPDEHSTEEIIRSYHEHQGDINMRPFFWKLLAAITTVASGGSAALEGPSIYGGGAIGSWLWTKLERFGLEPRDRRLMLMCGAAAGMAAVFRAPLTGIVFALEMPYKDDLAHEALLPSLIASVVAYGTLASLIGPEPLFGFLGTISFRPIDLAWSAALGIGCGIIAMVFTITFRRFRGLMINLGIPHTYKMAAGGLMTGICGLLFVAVFPGGLIPIGPNYEAVRMVLTQPHSSLELVFFAVLKLAATLFSLGVGGVSAMFVPLFLTGGALGSAFAQSIVHTPTFDLFAAVGMASFIAAGYKTPLTAVVFVAETTGGHSFIIPSLIGAACAYAISGEASASGDQRLHEVVKFSGIAGIRVSEVMQRRIVSVQTSTSLRDFAQGAAAHHRHAVFPVYDGDMAVGTVAVWMLTHFPPERWGEVTVGEVCNRTPERVAPSCDTMEALRLLAEEDSQQMLLVGSPNGGLDGIVTKTDILRSLRNGRASVSHDRREDAE